MRRGNVRSILFCLHRPESKRARFIEVRRNCSTDSEFRAPSESTYALLRPYKQVGMRHGTSSFSYRATSRLFRGCSLASPSSKGRWLAQP